MLPIKTLRDVGYEVGYEVLVLGEFIPIDSPDWVVIPKAQEIQAILVSLNGDFADIVTYPPSAYQGIISIQLKNHNDRDGNSQGFKVRDFYQF